MENYYFDCECSDFNHVFRFVLDNHTGEVWLEARINNFLPWHKRVWAAIKFIFKKDNAYGHYDVTLIKPEQFHNFINMIDSAEKIRIRNLINTEF